MFQRTFMRKMLVKLCAWFRPENAKTCFKHLEFFFSNERSHGLGVFFCRKKQVLQCRSANSTKARFSKYPTYSIQRKAADMAKALEGWPHSQVTYNNPQTELLSESQKGGIRPKYTILNSIARIHVWEDIHAKDVCQIMCLIWTWKCQSIFQTAWVIFSRMKEAVAFIVTASKGIRCCCCRFFFRKKQVLQCKSANSTMARFSQYPTYSIQRKAADMA